MSRDVARIGQSPALPPATQQGADRAERGRPAGQPAPRRDAGTRFSAQPAGSRKPGMNAQWARKFTQVGLSKAVVANMPSLKLTEAELRQEYANLWLHPEEVKAINSDARKLQAKAQKQAAEHGMPHSRMTAKNAATYAGASAGLFGANALAKRVTPRSGPVGAAQNAFARNFDEGASMKARDTRRAAIPNTRGAKLADVARHPAANLRESLTPPTSINQSGKGMRMLQRARFATKGVLPVSLAMTGVMTLMASKQGIPPGKFLDATKGSLIAGTAGGIVGGALGSLAGPGGTIVGGMIGSFVGEKLLAKPADKLAEGAIDLGKRIGRGAEKVGNAAEDAVDGAKKVVKGAGKVIDGAGKALDSIF